MLVTQLTYLIHLFSKKFFNISEIKVNIVNGKFTFFFRIEFREEKYEIHLSYNVNITFYGGNYE